MSYLIERNSSLYDWLGFCPFRSVIKLICRMGKYELSAWIKACEELSLIVNMINSERRT